MSNGIIILVMLAMIVVMLAAMRRVFLKARQPGWAAFVPIYNFIVLLRVAGKPVWWIVLFLIPVVNLVMAILVGIDVAKSFGQSTGFGLGLVFLGFIFYPILGFGSAQYRGPAGGGPPVLAPVY